MEILIQVILIIIVHPGLKMKLGQLPITSIDFQWRKISKIIVKNKWKYLLEGIWLILVLFVSLPSVK